MRPSIITFLSLAAFAAAAPQYVLGVTKRQKTYTIQACGDCNFEGKCAELEGTYGTCISVPANFNGALSSLAGDHNTSCFAFKNEGCTGDYFEIEPNTQTPLVPADLNGAISSVICPDYLMD